MIPNPFRVQPFHDPDTPSEREAVGRILFFREMAAYWHQQRELAVGTGDGQRMLAAFRDERHAERMLARWQRFLAEARENAGVPA